jgi:hypothetical protein
MQQLLPFFRLLGGSLRNQIISGSLNVSFGLLFCKENQLRLSKLLEDNDLIDSIKLVPYEELIGSYQYTRASAKAHKGAAECIRQDETDINDNLMIYNGQCIVPGSMFLIQLHLINCNDLELGALLNALQCYIDNGCNMGGMTRIGHGRIGLEFVDDEYNYEELIQMYRNHVETNSIAIENWLNETFPFVKKEVKEFKKATKKEPKKDKVEIEHEVEEQSQLNLFD